MKLDVLKSHLSHLSNIFRLSFSLYEKDTLIDTFTTIGDPFDVQKNLYNNTSDKEFYISQIGELEFAKIPVVDTEYVVYIGPCLSEEKTDRTTQNIMSIMEIPSNEYSEFDMYLSNLSTQYFFTFLSIVVSTYEAINQEIPDLRDVYSENATPEKIKRQIAKEQTLSASNRKRSWAFEERLNFLVEHGHVEELERLGDFSDMSATMGKIATSTLRQLQNTVENLVVHCTRAAMRAGVPPIIAYDLSDIYYLKIENATTFDELYAIAAKIPTLYATKVREFIGFKSNNLTVTKCIRYIYDNLSNKISLESIAKTLNVSPTYLSSQFSKELNMSIPLFIKTCRIYYSEYLLRFTEHSLVEIANSLNFSSQSAFQNAFKSVMGITPTEYRNANVL